MAKEITFHEYLQQEAKWKLQISETILKTLSDQLAKVLQKNSNGKIDRLY